jgi:myo-inositol 2-dehydrogenase / D-chiro-inositol 1-dehydrogenase
MSNSKFTSRRTFLKGATAAAAGLTLTGIARTAHAAGSDKIKVALIGCGGRGSGAIENCLDADPAIHLVAVADAFDRPANDLARNLTRKRADRVDIPSDRIFVGLDAYQKAIDCGIDMIVTATPPGFRPLIYNAAIKAGKHVFMEKPCCVDAPGFHLLMETNKLAEEKGLKVGVGLQRRHQANYIESIARVRDGALGKLILLQAFWNGTQPWNRRRHAGMTEMEYQVNNWYHFAWLSGDNIGEQHIHNLDVCNWVMDDHPIEANGMGGCTARYKGEWKGTGQIFDHHFVEFTYKNGVKLYSQCRHIANTWGNVSEHAFGTEASADLSGSPRRRRRGSAAAATTQPNMRFGDPYTQEHYDLITAIKKNEKYVEGWYGATSSMTSVLGRMATYSGQVVNWDDALSYGKSEFPKHLAWDAPAPVKKDADGDYPIPVPGIYRAYRVA